MKCLSLETQQCVSSWLKICPFLVIYLQSIAAEGQQLMILSLSGPNGDKRSGHIEFWLSYMHMEAVKVKNTDQKLNDEHFFKFS